MLNGENTINKFIIFFHLHEFFIFAQNDVNDDDDDDDEDGINSAFNEPCMLLKKLFFVRFFLQQCKEF